MGLSQPRHRGKWSLKTGPRELEEVYEAQPSPFTLFHHQDHFRTTHSWFFGILMISIN
jgi:hypothetical protein